MDSKLLVDVMPVRLSLDEAEQGGKIRVRGEFARVGQATENNRVYPEAVWSKEIKRLENALSRRRVLGHMDHPADGRTSLNQVSHLVTGMTVKDGILLGEAEILETISGSNLRALLKSGCEVGVSSRGYGSTKTNAKGEEEVQGDYKLVTFDFVADPADQTAYPRAFFEGVEFPMATTKDKDDAARAQLLASRARTPEGTDTNRLGEDMLAAVASLREELREEIRGELLTDPTVAGARSVLDKVLGLIQPYLLPEGAESIVKGKEAENARLRKELVERDLKIKELEGENGELAAAAKEAGYKFYVEHQVAGDPDALAIKRIVGDVMQYPDAASLKARLAKVRSELTTERRVSEKAASERSREVTRSRELTRQLGDTYEQEISTLREANEKLATANQMTLLRLYTEQKLQSHPKARKIRRLIEASAPETKEAVDQIFSQFNAPAPKDEDDATAVRARVRTLTRSSSVVAESEDSEDTEPPPRPRRLSEDYNGLGVDLTELQRLSGAMPVRGGK